MASTTLVPTSKYLDTTYRPDCDYLEGRVVERNWGEKEHGKLQGFFLYVFRLNREMWDVRVVPEQRVQVRPEWFRVPDICVERRSDPDESVVRQALLVCIEILSKRDTLTDIASRAQDYWQMGVRHIWAADPWKRVAYAWSDGAFRLEDQALMVQGTAITVGVAELFAELDQH